MNNFKEYSGRFCESDYENALISFLETEGWTYISSTDFSRVTKRDVLLISDLKEYIAKNNPEFSAEEIDRLVDVIKLVGTESDFATLHKVYKWIVDGFTFALDNGTYKTLNLIDFEDKSNNIFKVVNQLSIDYTNNGKVENRRPDILLYIN